MDKDTLRQYELIYFQNEEPVPVQLKEGFVNIYPISVRDWSCFESSSQILQIDKNDTNDIKIIQMSYMEYLINRISQNEQEKSMLMITLLKSFHEEKIGFVGGENPCIIIADDNDVVRAKINHKEFDKIKDIILHYNIPNYDDENMSRDMKKLIEDYYKVKNTGNYHSPTLEERKAYVIAKTSMSMKEINEMAYRTFNMVYQSALESEMFLANKIIQASFKYQIKDDVQHPLFAVRKTIYDEVFGNKEEFVNKINMANNG